jgi:hypothetical protein
MKSRTRVLLSSAMGLSALVAVTAVAETAALHGFRGHQIEDALFHSLVGEGIAWPYVPNELKALAPNARAAVANELGKAVRAYAESPAFAERWAKHVADATPEPPKPVRPYADLVKERRAELEKQKQASKAALTNLKPDQRAQLEKSMEQAFLVQEQMLQNRNIVEMTEKARFDSEKKSYDTALERNPKDPKAKVRAAIDAFLAETADIDFKAKLVDRDGRQVFEKAAYEGKSDNWKRAFRAGKEATTAARTFAQAWKKSLK